jgi:parvulin-like peptidyl-prolyl isomerase
MIMKTLFSLFVLLQPGQILVDKIAAIVNDEIITIHDIERAIAFYPTLRQKNETEENIYFRVLSDLINFKMISQEFGDEFNLSEEDFEQVQTPILKKAGSMEKLLSVLNGFTMTWSDFQNFIREKVLYEKVLKEKFQLEITIPFNEIENFYNSDYVVSQQRLGLAPQTLVEMAPVIEKYLRQLRTEEQLSAWLNDLRANYKIEIKLRSRQ